MAPAAASRFRLPTTATAPFCPAEVRGTVPAPAGLPFWKRALRMAGPGLLVAVGYMDPGNWATDIEAGSRFGYQLLAVVFASSLAAMLMQVLCARLGLAAGRDLAQLSHDRYGPVVRYAQWLLAELAIIACDIAEVLGCALAFQLAFGLPLWIGVLVTGFDTLLVLGLKGRGFRQVEAIVLGLIATVALCFLIELVLIPPSGAAVASGLLHTSAALGQTQGLYLAVGIIGATVMPHNLYLHSSVVQTRATEGETSLRRSIRWATADIVVALFAAMFVNAAILMTAAAAFHGKHVVGSIEDAHALLAPIAGTTAAAWLFALALFASGQSSTFTGTIAGQVIMDGFLQLRIPCWVRRLITRTLAIIPALIGVLTLGEGSVGKMLVLTQVVLSAQLPFALWSLIRFTGDRALMGDHVSSIWMKVSAWGLFGIISAANLWLVWRVLTGGF